MNCEVKKIRKASRCIIMEDDKVVVTKYEKGNHKEGFYEIPGGKIEEGESAEEAAIREVKEETGMTVSNLQYKGNLILEYPDRIFDFQVFLTSHFEGKPQNFIENSSEWILLEELVQKEKLLSNIILLDRFFIQTIKDERFNFTMKITTNDEEQILALDYKIREI